MYTDLLAAIAPEYVYENITVTRDADFKNINIAYTIVEEYLKANNLILYGGMSIDFALRAAGHKGLYADDSIPDYDFYSPTAYEDSIKIADLLHSKRLPNISAITALHPTTRRVRVNYTNVADISYLPNSIFTSMPYLEHAGMRVIHPMYQRLDQHRAMAVPYEKAPGETVYFRGSKDIKRYRLLDRAYPVVIEPSLIAGVRESHMTTIKISCEQIAGEVISGIPAYAFMYTLMSSLYPDECSELCKITVRETGGKFEIQIPEALDTVKICILSTNFIKAQKRLNSGDAVKYFKRYMDDIKPRSIEILGPIHWDLYDSSKFPITCVKASSVLKIAEMMKAQTGFKFADFYIAAAPNVLLYLLALYYIESKPGYLYMYWSMCRLIEIAEQHVHDFSDPELFQQLPLFLTAKIKGTHNVDFPYILATRRTYETIHGLEDSVSKIVPMRGYFPSTSDALPVPFDTTTSWLFDMDGTELEPGKKFTECDYDIQL